MSDLSHAERGLNAQSAYSPVPVDMRAAARVTGGGLGFHPGSYPPFDCPAPNCGKRVHPVSKGQVTCGRAACSLWNRKRYEAKRKERAR